MKASQILIVEDQVLTIRMIEVYLTDWGYEICGKARTMNEALEIAAQNPPDLALLDINLGKGMESDGIELALRFRQQYAFPIIFLTGESKMQLMEAAKAAKPDAYLSKPISEVSLAFAIDDALKKASERLIQPTELAHSDPPKTEEEGPNLLLNDHIFVKKDSSYKKIAIEDIYWIRADRQYLNIQTKEEVFLVSTYLSNFAEQFQHDDLLRISRSHIINVNAIDEFEEQHMVIVAGQAIPIGKTYRKEVQQRFRFLRTSRGTPKSNDKSEPESED